MWRKFTEKQTRRWVDMLDDLVDEYNNTKESIPHQKVRAKRINIFYILTLLYGKKGKYRLAFSELIKNMFVENSLSTFKEIDKKINEIEANIIDFPQMQKDYEAENLKAELSNGLDSNIVAEFIKCNNGDLIDTLDKMNDLMSAGHLDEMVLKKHSRSIKKPDSVLEVSGQIATTQ